MSNRDAVKAVFKSLQNEIHDTAVDRGWWDDYKNLKQLLQDHGADYKLDPSFADTAFIFIRTMLVVSELSEGIEAFRDGNRSDDKLPEYKGLSVELADAHIRLHDMEAQFGLPVTDAMLDKVEFNKGRSFKHGGKSV